MSLVKEDQDSFYRLKRLVRQEKLKIFLILANPRTGSTILETSFIQNPAFSIHVHEPFHRKDDLGKHISGYRVILDMIPPEASGLNVLVKDIGEGIISQNEYQRFLTIVDQPPILLIRNPLLSVESKIRAVLKSLSLRNSITLKNMLRRFLASERFNIDENSLDQNDLLNQFAVIKGYRNWSAMLLKTFTDQKYQTFEEILRDSRINKLEPMATLEQMHYLQSAGRDFIVVDSTDYRTNPEKMVKSLCKRWDIKYNKLMIEWGSQGKKINIGQSHMEAWFGRVGNSTGIEKPSEVSPLLSDFPGFISKHLIKEEFPAYYEMLRSTKRIKSGRISIKPNEVYPDPIYLLMSDPELFTDLKYLEVSKKYLPTINIINNIII